MWYFAMAIVADLVVVIEVEAVMISVNVVNLDIFRQRWDLKTRAWISQQVDTDMDTVVLWVDSFHQTTAKAFH